MIECYYIIGCEYCGNVLLGSHTRLVNPDVHTSNGTLSNAAQNNYQPFIVCLVKCTMYATFLAFALAVWKDCRMQSA